MSQEAEAPGPVPAAPHRFERPVFVVAAPSSGSRVLAEALSGSLSAWTAGPAEDGRPVIESMPAVQAANRGWDSDRLTAADALAASSATACARASPSGLTPTVRLPRPAPPACGCSRRRRPTRSGSRS